jgi:predicted anti-sigma-YlaC factor YlaD
MTNKLHYTSEQFNLLLDGRISGSKEKEMRNHLGDCNDCTAAFENLARIDAMLRDVSVVETDPEFTRKVMDRILVASKSSFAFRLFEKMSYAFGLLIVLGIMIAAFVMTGVFNQSQFDQTKSIASELAGKVGGGVSGSIAEFTSLLVQYLPFAFGKGSMGVAFFAVAVIAMLAVVDKLVGRKVMQK